MFVLVQTQQNCTRSLLSTILRMALKYVERGLEVAARMPHHLGAQNPR
jgi:hypothetical protein